jgi:hypothetical protein
MKTNFYQVKVGVTTKKNAFIESHSFVVSSTELTGVVWKFYNDKYEGLSVQVSEIKQAPINLVIPKVATEREENTTTPSRVNFLRKEVHAGLLIAKIGIDFKTALSEYKESFANKIKKEKELKRMIETHFETMHESVANSCSVEDFSSNEDPYSFYVKINLNGMLYSDL